jgi:hypothetical protein
MRNRHSFTAATTAKARSPMPTSTEPNALRRPAACYRAFGPSEARSVSLYQPLGLRTNYRQRDYDDQAERCEPGRVSRRP